ncbi:MAG: hypothetical protein EOP09_05150 [Proteobacteria bacterium]|nr:MAG: hypothetical protein EOP09_05150 [Pseudomonadota bacterium]
MNEFKKEAKIFALVLNVIAGFLFLFTIWQPYRTRKARLRAEVVNIEKERGSYIVTLYEGNKKKYLFYAFPPGFQKSRSAIRYLRNL